MRCLIRTLRRGGISEDLVIVAKWVSFGRAEDQDFRLHSHRAGLRHALIARGTDGALRIRSLVPIGIVHNGRRLAEAVLKPGDELGVGGVHFRVGEPPEGHDLYLETGRQGREPAGTLPGRTHAPRADWSMRKASWTLVLAVTALFLLVPLAGFVYKPLGIWLRTLPVVSDLGWNSGPLAPAHRFFETDCNRCHARAFISVRNSACTDCHKDMPHHVDAGFRAAGGFEPTRCEACHKEHNGRDAFIRRDEALCTGCHRNLEDKAPDAKLKNVSGFDEGHPEFRPTLVRFEAGEERAVRISMHRKNRLVERSHLEFGHAGHLKKEGIKKPDGDTVQLQCADCHVSDAGGKRMAPVRFETHCHDCHKLNFEPDDPGEELPHGDDRGLLTYLEGYYAERALRGGYRHLSAPGVVQERRRPGAALTPREHLEIRDWVAHFSREMGTEIIRYRVCATCHTVAPNTAAEPMFPWKVEPVRISAHWLPKADFDHGPHETQDCSDCHDAEKSKDSSDVLLRGIGKCRDCHGDSGAENKTASTCTDCHGFHVSKTLSMDGKNIGAVRGKVPVVGPVPPPGTGGGTP